MHCQLPHRHPVENELRLLEFQNRRSELRVYVLLVLTCRLFRRASPHMKDIVRRKALQSAPRSGRIFASEGALGDLWAVCGVVKSTARACPYGRLGQTTKPGRGKNAPCLPKRTTILGIYATQDQWHNACRKVHGCLSGKTSTDKLA